MDVKFISKTFLIPTQRILVLKLGGTRNLQKIVGTNFLAFSFAYSVLGNCL